MYSKNIQVYIGQGDGDTKWKGWPWYVLLSLNQNQVLLYKIR